MTNSNAQRIAIIGNSASGKSTLARRLGDEHGLAHLDLDTLAWLPADEPTASPTRVPLDQASESLRAFTGEHAGWVVEGCYADLVELLLPQVGELVFLDLPVETCRARASARPWEPHKYASKEAQDANLSMLLDWIAAYPERDGPLGRRAHVALFRAHDGPKRRVTR